MQPYKAALVKTTGTGEKMQIFVRPGLRTITLNVRPSATVAVVKHMIHIRTFERSSSQPDAAVVPADTIKLEYGGRVESHPKQELNGGLGQCRQWRRSKLIFQTADLS